MGVYSGDPVLGAEGLEHVDHLPHPVDEATAQRCKVGLECQQRLIDKLQVRRVELLVTVDFGLVNVQPDDRRMFGGGDQRRVVGKPQVTLKPGDVERGRLGHIRVYLKYLGIEHSSRTDAATYSGNLG